MDRPGGRWQRVAGVLLAVVMVGATGGILGIVIRNSVLLATCRC